MDAPKATGRDGQPKMTTGEKTVLDLHEAIVSDLLEELPYEAKIVAMQVLRKHQQKIVDDVVGAGKQVEPSVVSMFDVWLKISTDAQAFEEDRLLSRRKLIRAIFKSHGFTVKEGETDLKEYVFRAGIALLDRVEEHYRKNDAIKTFFAETGFSHKTVEQYEAMEDRSKWTVGQWAKHLGAWEDGNYNVVFGSWAALARMLELRDAEMMRQAVLLATHGKKLPE